jgi:hypothetical protein
LGQDAVVKRNRERHEQDRKHAGSEPPDATISPSTQFALTLEHEPAGAEQRVAEHESEPGEDCKRVQPAERSGGVLAIRDWNAAHHRADRGALNEGDKTSFSPQLSAGDAGVRKSRIELCDRCIAAE